MPFYSSVHNKFNKLSTKSTESQKGFDYNGDTPKTPAPVAKIICFIRAALFLLCGAVARLRAKEKN